MRTLGANQTRDPARGSFIVRARMTKEYGDGRRVFVAPTTPVPGSDKFETHSNAIEFVPKGDQEQ